MQRTVIEYPTFPVARGSERPIRSGGLLERKSVHAVELPMVPLRYRNNELFGKVAAGSREDLPFGPRPDGGSFPAWLTTRLDELNGRPARKTSSSLGP
jgi:hypothetical protein